MYKKQQEEIYQIGWNTFSNDGLNVFVHPKYGIKFSLIFLSDENNITYKFGFNVGQSIENPPWHKLHKNIKGLGKCEVLERDRNLAYARINYLVNGGKLRVTCANRYYDNIVLKLISGENLRGKFYVLGELFENSPISSFQLGAKGIDLNSKTVQGFFRIINKNEPVSFFDTLEDVDYFLKRGIDHESLDRGKKVVLPLKPDESYFSVLIASKNIKMAQNISKFVGSEQHVINSNKVLYEKYSTKLSVDNSSDLDIGILAPIYWNLSYDYKKKSIYVPVSKSWVNMMENIMDVDEKNGDGPLIFNWGTAFAALSLTQFDLTLAKDLINGLLAHQKKNGSIPHLIVGNKKTNLINPPIIFLACMKIFIYGRDYKYIKEIFPKLDRYFNYLMENRYGSDQYRMAYGAPIKDETYPGLCGKIGASYESGMDDSPAWEDGKFNKETQTMEINSVGFTSLMCLSSSIMWKLASIINLPKKSSEYSKHFNQFRRSILNYFFDKKSGTFKNRKFNDEFSPVITPDSFYPLLTGKLGKDFINNSLEMLNDEEQFGNEFMIPSLIKSHPDYDPDGDYWRGRIWPPLNYLTHLGLITQNRSEESFKLAYNSFMMFHREYEENRHVHENYSAKTGYGEPEKGTYARSCPMFTWGNLMGLMLLEEIFNVDWDFKLHFGCFYLKNNLSFQNIKVGRVFYSIFNNPEKTLLKKNQNDFISATPASRFLEFTEEWDKIKFKILGNGLTTIKLYNLGDRVEIYVRVNNKPAHYINMPRKAPVTFDINCDPKTPKNITIFMKR